MKTIIASIISVVILIGMVPSILVNSTIIGLLLGWNSLVECITGEEPDWIFQEEKSSITIHWQNDETIHRLKVGI